VIVTPPGEEAQVDYGTGPMVRHPVTGKYRRTRLFVLTLGYSRKSVRLLLFESSTRSWAELHEQAFRRLGGVVRVVVLDNLREGVLTPDAGIQVSERHLETLDRRVHGVGLPVENFNALRQIRQQAEELGFRHGVMASLTFTARLCPHRAFTTCPSRRSGSYLPYREIERALTERAAPTAPAA
jgi:hypothetical protein